MATTDSTVDILNRLLRGELAATETYQQALAKVGDEPGGAELRRMESDHRDAANVLRQHIIQRSGQPDSSSGVWGMWAQAVTGTAKLFGNTAALKALKEGEEHGIKEYEDALEDKDLDQECKTLIRSTLLPRQRAHLAVLDRLIESP